MLAGRIPIGWLNTQAYCEYRIYLEHVKGIAPEPTIELLQGRDKHSALEEKHIKVAEFKMSVPEALAKASKEKVMCITREVPVAGQILYGRIDEVHFLPDLVRIIDDKPGDTAYLSDRRQVWGYCLAFEEHYRPERPIEAVLRNLDSKNLNSKKEFGTKLFSEQARQDVIDSTNRIKEVVSGQRQAEPSSNPNKCKSCRLKKDCDKRSGNL